MTTVFISYRRSDAAASTGRIADRLQMHFGDSSICYDVDTIPLGIDFRQYLSERLDQCDVFLAVIGDQWLDARDDDGNRRLDDPADNVRLEVATALQREQIPVIPVLVGNKGVPKERDLPDGLKKLAYRNAIEVRSDADFDGQIARLITAIERIVGRKESGGSAAREAPGPSAASPRPLESKPGPTPPPAAAKRPPASRVPARSVSYGKVIGVAVVVFGGPGIWYSMKHIRTDGPLNVEEAPLFRQRPLVLADLEGKSDWELDVMRNEIYARHGRRFARADLQRYFEQQPWYVPKYDPNEFPLSLLTELESTNAERIRSFQERPRSKE